MRKLGELIITLFILGMVTGILPAFGLYLLYTFPILNIFVILLIVLFFIIEIRIGE